MRWIVGLPCHHPAWPRYCTRCGNLAEGSLATKTLRLRIPESYIDKIRHPEALPIVYIEEATISQNILIERVSIPEVPALVISFALTACIKCNVFFTSERDRNHKEIGGIYSAVMYQWGKRIVVVKDYKTIRKITDVS